MMYQEHKNRLFLILAAVIAVYFPITINDRALFLLFIPVPFIVCGGI